ncbi:gas vesicle protein K [Krasilnikovia sp. MM14-A1004]|uniref:gas vesicle protein K n=1 Tax=Krasilnikovia sp. MM14-A1004 TaxID=3373541 RepID=UPI00399CF5EC
MTAPGNDAAARLELEPESVERGLATLVLTVVELLRQLMERQALRRVDGGELTAEQVEKLGITLMTLEDHMARLCDHFGLTLADLNLDLGPLGPLLGPSDPPRPGRSVHGGGVIGGC